MTAADVGIGQELFADGADWEELTDVVKDGVVTVNMGPQHPSTHGVLRLVLDLEGEKVLRVRPVIGYLHTGIEKNAEYRTWVQGCTFFTRMDYLSPFANETAYCMAIERMLGITVPHRAEVVRVVLNEFQRIASHLVWLATGGMELGAVSMMIYGFREREHILDLFESQTGLRMNHAYIRPGGLAADVTSDFEYRCEKLLVLLEERFVEYNDLLRKNPIWNDRLRGTGVVDADTAIKLGITGPVLRASGIGHDLRKAQPYGLYDEFDFDIPTADTGDNWGRFEVRMAEVDESMKIIRQALKVLEPGPVMVDDTRIAWPSQQALGADGLGNDPEYIRKIMGESMEALINHFKLVTQGFTVPAGQVYQAIESPRGELGYHVTSVGTNRPWRVHVREPSFVHIQAIDAMCRGDYVSDIVATIASLDPVMGGVDR